MSDIKYINLKNSNGTACVPFSAARYLTIALPQLSPEYQENSLHLQIRWALDIVSDPLQASDFIDTGIDATQRISLFTGSSWISMSEHGFTQDYANCRVMIDTKGIDPFAFLYYSWYYVQNGVTIHITPWASTKLTATAGIPKHSELQDRNATDQHTISAITGLQDILSRDYREIEAKTDASMSNATVPQGKIIIFVGYHDGTANGELCMRYKTASGIFGTLTGNIHAGLEDDDLIINGGSTQDDENLDISDNSAYVDEANSMLILSGPSYSVDTENRTLYISAL
jgi:hypothetical protein